MDREDSGFLKGFMEKFAGSGLTAKALERVQNFGKRITSRVGQAHQNYIEEGNSLRHKVRKGVGAGIVGTTGALWGIHRLTAPTNERRVQAGPYGGQNQ